jgi:small-conductance mechanosensitive channel
MTNTTKAARLCVFIIAIIALAGMAQAQKIPKSKPPKAEVKSEEAVVPAAPQTPEQVDAFMGSLTDEKARQVLTQMLRHQTAAKAASNEDGVVIGRKSGLGPIFYRMIDNASSLMKKLSGTITQAEAESDDLGAAWRKLTGGKGTGRFLLALLSLLAILAVGLLLRGLLFQSTRDIRERLFASVRPGRLEFFGRALLRLILEALGIAVFALATFILLVLFFQNGDLGFEFVSVYLLVSYYVLIFAGAAKVIFSPDAPALRLFPMKDADAAFLYRWIIVIVAGAAVFSGASAVMGEIEAGKAVYLMFYSLGGAYIAIALIVMIWQSRQRIAEAILPANAEAGPGGPRAVFARYWHYVASVYVLCMGVYWIADVLLGGKVTILNLILSLFVIPIFIGLDQWGLRLLTLASGEMTQVADLSGDQVREVPPIGEQNKIKRFAPLIRKLYRLMLVAFLFFLVLRLWGVDVAVGRIFTSHVLSIVVTLLLGFITWEFIKARIDSRLRQEMPEVDDDHEEGGAGGTRAGTLLILFRKFVSAVLFVIVALIVLSSIGVNIGPLIAGAGVIGLAIGFGAQTLVRDIIAGVFFLIDDSFRVGDYVESAGIKGTVEKVSLRSLKLRHPRGMVYTVPFGTLKSITNFSRDYTITKLDFRVRLDTDLEKVRKIIKKINKNLRKDEAINRVMLDDLKSQGVKQFEDSAMILRVKFKTLPGEQFVIQKEVYRMVQEEFRASDIQFAHRDVTVYIPPEPKGRAIEAVQPAASTQSVDQNIRQAGAAAALAVIQQEEEERAKALAAAKPKEI